jgi:hypothetical protein
MNLLECLWFIVCVAATGALIVGAMWLAHGDRR